MAWDSTTFPWDLDAESFHIVSHGTGNELRKLTSTGNGRLLETELSVGNNGVPFHCSKELGPVVPATGTSSLAKQDASATDYHASRHTNGFSRESSSSMPTTCPSSLHSQEDLNEGWHGTLHTVGSGMVDTHSVLPSNGVVGQSEGSCMTYGVIPTVTTCIASGLGFLASYNNDTAVHSSGNSAQKGVLTNGKQMEYTIAGVSEQGGLHQEPWQMQQGHHHQISLSKKQIHLGPMKVKEEKNMASTFSVKAHTNDEQRSSNAAGSAGSGDSFTGLHLGKRTYMPDVVKATSSKAAPKPVLAPKKARTGVAIPRCQVEGCKLDLTSAKDYHRKHKVCEVHAKAGKAIVASSEQRFCQQCSRFHALCEFDEAKRSCRRRLAGHNERRRKPQPDPLGLHRFHSAYEDWSFLHQPMFSRMPILWQDAREYQSGAIWPCATTPSFDNHPSCDYAMQGPAMERQGYMKSLSQSSLSCNNNKLSLLLLQSPKSVMPNSVGYPRAHHNPYEVLGGPLGDTLTLAPSSGGGGMQGLDTAPVVTRGVTRVSDSGRALSLLSLQSRGPHAPDISMPDPTGLANMLTLNHHQLVHSDGAIVPQQFPFHAGQQYQYDVSVEKNMISMALPSPQTNFDGGGHMGFMADDCGSAQDLNRQASAHPLFALMPYPQADELSQGGLHHGGATA